MLGVGLVWPILPQLVRELTGQEIEQAALTYGLLTSGFALILFFSSPILGLLSDHFGRRPILLVSLAILGVDYLIMANAQNIYWLIVARIIAGMFSATISTANAAIADITEPQDRAKAFGFIGAAFGVGFIIGPLIGGVVGQYSLQAPFFLAAALAFANFGFGALVFQETLSEKKRKKIEIKNANPFSALMYIRRYPSLNICLTAFIISGFAQQGLQGMWVLWIQKQFGWGVKEAGYTLAYVGLVIAIVQGGLVGIVVKKIGEVRTVIIGFIAAAISFALLPTITQGWVVYPCLLLHLVGWGCASPTLTAIMSKNVPQNEQGLLQGASNSLYTLAMIAGPIVATSMFAQSQNQTQSLWAGSFYIVGAILFVIAAGLFLKKPKKLVTD